MKKSIILAVVCLFFVFGNLAYSEMTGKFSFTPQAGINLPIGDYGDLADLGLGFGGSIEYNLLSQFAVGGTFAYNLSGASDDYKAALQVIAAGFTGDPNATIDDVESFKIWSLGVHGKYNVPTQSKVTPFLKLGLGVYGFSPGDASFTFSSGTGKFVFDSETKFGVNPGAGVNFNLSETMNVFFEGSFHNIFIEGENIQYFNVFGGVTLMFGGKRTPSAE